jgi:hypothetical protein
MINNYTSIYNDRFIGFRVRANIILHLGTDGNSLSDGYGSLFYWGSELGLRIYTEYLILEPSFSIGEGTYQVGNNINLNFQPQNQIYS